ncbi:MAG: PQQ-like beta-propeller repeat protein [Bryobacterales bacterium]|nr:PQQ-like beta-propeller repeat protein [Bryobacterales bacterium]
MTAPNTPLRLWPGIAIVAIQWLLWLVLPALVPEAMIVGVVAGLVGTLIILIWWTFFSRAPRLERFAALPLMIVAGFATRLILHPSIATGMMGIMFLLYVLPVLSLALVVWAAFGRRLSPGARLPALLGASLLAASSLALLRTDGVTGTGHSRFHWRWTPTAEQQLLAQTPVLTPAPPPEPKPEPTKPVAEPKLPSPTPATPPLPAPDWPGFRGPNRDAQVAGLKIATNWSINPPVELWRHPIGPGWSSFAIGEGRLYTQEQRGESEVVSCYALPTGAPLWTHTDPVRFWESNAGAGPRATPTLHNNRVYSFGATGVLNALNARTGAVVWTRNAAVELQAKVPVWGFSSSPLVLDDTLLIAISGRLAAYNLVTGAPRWVAPAGPGSYSSPQLVVIDGIPQVVLMNGSGATSYSPTDGSILWQHAWEGTPIVQPALLPGNNLLVTTAGASGGFGIRNLALTRTAANWTSAETWTSTGLKPYFNDFVTNKGHAYGFDGAILSSISLQDGKRNWKGGRFGHGQLLLLSDQDLLLILSEEGELALVSALPNQFTELARFPALDDKTWNHPAIAGNVLVVRNGQEMAAFRLPAEAIK